MNIQQLIETIGEKCSYSFSDIILKESFDEIGVKIKWEVHVTKINEPLDINDLKVFIENFSKNAFVSLIEKRFLDISIKIGKYKYRINVTYSMNKVMVVLRKLTQTIIPLDNLWITPILLEQIKNANKWLFLISWRTGSWKSTTLASLIDYFNLTRKNHIITLESPIEIEFGNKSSYINQKELERDFHTYEQALEDCLREAPDIIMIGEIRNKVILKKALEIANSWHLVLWTIHSNNTSWVIWKILRSWDNEKEIANELADCLLGVMHQESIYYNWKFVLIVETLYNNGKVRACLLNGKPSGLKSIIQTSLSEWMTTLEQNLENDVYNNGAISWELFKDLFSKFNNLWI